jgi:hypothetical protein
MSPSNYIVIDTGSGSAVNGNVPENCKQITVIGIGPSGTAFGVNTGATVTVQNVIGGVPTAQIIQVVQGIPLNFSYESGPWYALTYAKGAADRLIIYYVYN